MNFRLGLKPYTQIRWLSICWTWHWHPTECTSL